MIGGQEDEERVKYLKACENERGVVGAGDSEGDG